VSPFTVLVDDDPEQLGYRNAEALRFLPQELSLWLWKPD
jgi:hypothetical protein